jgi:signal transduction histidine kinase
MIREAVAIARAEIARTNVNSRLDLAPEPLCILGDRVQVQQVMLNLLRNALEAMATVGSGERILTISSRRQDGKTVISVVDTGPGLSAEAQGKVFEAFSSTKPTGMGMGLAISRSIVRFHEGVIRVTQNAPRGSRFEIEFPLLDREAGDGYSVAQPRRA